MAVGTLCFLSLSLSPRSVSCESKNACFLDIGKRGRASQPGSPIYSNFCNSCVGWASCFYKIHCDIPPYPDDLCTPHKVFCNFLVNLDSSVSMSYCGIFEPPMGLISSLPFYRWLLVLT